MSSKPLNVNRRVGNQSATRSTTGGEEAVGFVRFCIFTLGFAVESKPFLADEGLTSKMEAERRSRVCL